MKKSLRTLLLGIALVGCAVESDDPLPEPEAPEPSNKQAELVGNPCPGACISGTGGVGTLVELYGDYYCETPGLLTPCDSIEGNVYCLSTGYC